MLLSVQTSVATVEDARRLASALIEARLAACAQIERIESLYRWEGALQQEEEFRITFKVPEAGYEALATEIRRIHPYTLPMILALSCVRVQPDFEAWVQESCQASTL